MKSFLGEEELGNRSLYLCNGERALDKVDSADLQFFLLFLFFCVHSHHQFNEAGGEEGEGDDCDNEGFSLIYFNRSAFSLKNFWISAKVPSLPIFSKNELENTRNRGICGFVFLSQL